MQNNYQELRQQNDVLQQRLSALEGNTKNTTQPGPGDKNGLPSSCTEVTERSGFNTDRFYVIDPDGPDRGVLPMTVQCDVEGGTAITLIGHNSETRTHVNAFTGPGSYSKNVTYWNNMDQMRVLIDQSSLCKQHIKYECYHSVIWDSAGTPHAWWVTWDGRQADYWGGASPGSGKCACGHSGTCSKRCNCDADDSTWREDSGFLFHKDDLPVTQLRFGDTSRRTEQGHHTLGKLICYP
ncbi:contactin-associated protein-like 5 [Branchiostoma lanceolatum]|uniref:contactin-associated protein-like 5 n=1 Tax=Branchiostoma lanceolatum TaxID=7740 RepID=UPI003456DF4E